MMYIKLPWKKVRRACETIVEYHSTDVTRLTDRYREAMVRWGELKSCNESKPVKPDLSIQVKECYEMRDMIQMCDHAKGGVFVSLKMWKHIRRYYPK